MRTEKDFCEEHGEYECTVTEALGRVYKTGCPVCAELHDNKIEKIMRESAEEEARRLYQIGFQMSGIAERFANATFSTYETKTEKQGNALSVAEEYAQFLSENIRTDGCLFMCGGFGTGKTHLGIAIIRHLADLHGIWGRYTTTLKMIRDIRSSYRHGAKKSEQELIDEYSSVPVLVLDEVGVQFGTEGEKILLFEVLNGRYNEIRPTVIISNLAFGELQNYLGERVIDRLKSKNGKLVVMEWESYRRKL